MDRFLQCIDWMEQNPSIAVFTFKRSPKLKTIKDGLYPGFGKIPIDADYRINAQMALWRRDKLIKYILPHESPWQFEVEGTIRSRQYKEDFYAIDNNSSLPKIFSYYLRGVVHMGRWDRKGIMPLNKKYNLGIDFSQRGFHPAKRIRLREAVIKFTQATRTYTLARWLYLRLKR